MFQDFVNQTKKLGYQLLGKERTITMHLNNDQPRQVIVHFNANLYNQIRQITQIQDIIITYEGKLLGKEEELNESMHTQKEIQLCVYSFQWIVDYLLIEFKKLQELHQKTFPIQQSISNPQQQSLILNIFSKDLPKINSEVLNYNQILIQNYEKKISQLMSNISNTSDLKPLLSDCTFCQQEIQSDCIQLSCNHNYHEQCFQDLIKAQLLEKCLTFKCICKGKISKQTLKLCNQIFATKSLLEVFTNELEQIKRNCKFKVVTCFNKRCGFFFIKTDKTFQGTRCIMCNP